MESFADRMERQYSQDINADEFDDGDDDNDDEDFRNATLSTNSPPNRTQVRQARQSTIVQVNTGALEVYNNCL